MQSLDTPRLLLRPLRLDDADAYFPLVSDAAINRYTGQALVADVEGARALLQQHPLRDYALHGFGRHAVIEKSSGELIGFCGLKRLPELGEVDIGYRFLPRCWGRGYATESAREALRWGREVLGLRRIVGLVVRENAASARILTRLGLRLESQLSLPGPHGSPFDVDLYA